MGRFALRNGPNRSAKRPISHGETAHFATQYGQVLMAACVPLCFSAAQMRVCLWCVWLKNRLVVAVCRNLLVTLFAVLHRLPSCGWRRATAHHVNSNTYKQHIIFYAYRTGS